MKNNCFGGDEINRFSADFSFKSLWCNLYFQKNPGVLPPDPHFEGRWGGGYRYCSTDGTPWTPPPSPPLFRGWPFYHVRYNCIVTFV